MSTGEVGFDAQSVEERLHTAVSLHRSGEIGQAEKIYLELHEEAPEHPDVLHFLGVLRHQQGAHETAIELIRGAVERAPTYVDAWNNLGNVYWILERFEEAEEAYRRTLELNEKHAGAWNNLALILSGRRAFEEALDAHRRVLELVPNAPDAVYNYANTLRACGDPDQAIIAYRRTLALNPGHDEANQRFAYMLHLAGRKEEGREVMRNWAALEPNNPVAQHMLAAHTGENVPERASDEYVRRVFDSFSTSFDQVLLQRLGYRAPKLVGEALGEVLGEPRADRDILDAGCGTGLCGEYLRPYARVLSGVDLSPGMIQKAITRGGYDRFHVAVLTAFLESSPASFDVVASADTLVYFGPLERVFSAAAGTLRPGGWLALTLEDNHGEADYSLRAHGRYGHSEHYVRQMLTAAGFDEISVAPVSPRTEVGEEVPGHLVRARVPRNPE